VTPAALVTGVGAATARRLDSDGCAVAAAGRRQGPNEEVAAEIGGLDALVLDAGVGREGPLLDLASETFEDVPRVDVTGAFLAARTAIPHLTERRCAIAGISPCQARARRVRSSPTAPRRPPSPC